jgi:hypothetical protein
LRVQDAQVVLAQHHRLARALREPPTHRGFDVGRVRQEGFNRVIALGGGPVTMVQGLPAHACAQQLAVHRHPEPDGAGTLMKKGCVGHGRLQG